MFPTFLQRAPLIVCTSCTCEDWTMAVSLRALLFASMESSSDMTDTTLCAVLSTWKQVSYCQMSHQQGPSQLLELCSVSDGLVHYNFCAFGLVKPYTTTHEDVSMLWDAARIMDGLIAVSAVTMSIVSNNRTHSRNDEREWIMSWIHVGPVLTYMHVDGSGIIAFVLLTCTDPPIWFGRSISSCVVNLYRSTNTPS